MSHRVALCTICNAPGQTSLPANKGKKKAGKKKKNAAPWESDGDEEPEVPLYPPGVMKARGYFPALFHEY